MGRTAFTAAEAPSVRAQLQSDLSAGKRSVSLKHADDQSVAALLAVRSAMHDADSLDMSAWGILAAPRTPGRPVLEATLERFQSEGAWGVSPNIIPNYSLHSLAGFLSVTLDIRGPNLGVGGLPNSESDIWPVANAWLADDSIPAVWIVLTGWSNAICRAVVMVARRINKPCDCVVTYCPPGNRSSMVAPPFSLESFDRIVGLGQAVSMRSRWSLPFGASLEWRRTAV